VDKKNKMTPKERVSQTKFHLILGTIAVIAEAGSFVLMTWIHNLHIDDYVLMFGVVFIWMFLFARFRKAKSELV
jgi:hypothetical protein